jgi:hypothetical protein
MWLLKLNMATDAYSVWAEVWYRRLFAGGSIGDHAQLSPTPISIVLNIRRVMRAMVRTYQITMRRVYYKCTLGFSSTSNVTDTIGCMEL